MPEEVQPPDTSKSALFISFDPATQVVGLFVDNEQVKNWDFAEGLLRMALNIVKLNQRMAQQQALNQMAHQQMQALQAQAQHQQVLRQLRGNGPV